MVAPQELPVGLLTALLGGIYLMVLLHRRGER
jgi:iron complex transport system permease protein